MLKWNEASERYFQHGIDRGVWYPDKPENGSPVAWNGIVSFDESGNGDPALYYIDGQIYLADVDPTNFSGKLTAYSWPEAVSKCIGMPEVADGFYADNQKAQRFSFSYRSLVGSGLDGDVFGYQIHLVYKAMATIGSKSRQTINDTPEAMTFDFDMVCTPVPLPGHRPTAHFVIDTRHLSKATVAALELMLYGDANHVPRLPLPLEIFELLNFGSAITFVKYIHPDLGECWRATGAYENVHYVNDNEFVIRNVNGTDLGNGTYQLRDTL